MTTYSSPISFKPSLAAPGRSARIGRRHPPTDLLATETLLLGAYDPVNMPAIISKEGRMPEGKVHVEIVYCVV
jgi:hypothetical protein